MTLEQRVRALSPRQRDLLARNLAQAAGTSARRLIAYVVTDPRRPAEAAELRDYLGTVLPEYMVPASFLLLQEWPRLPNGKIDRQALQAAAPGAARAGRGAFVPPSDEPERAVARIWKELLGVEAVGADDNFFDLGGHSLLLVRLQSRLRGEFGAELSIVDLFRYATVRGLAAALRAAAGAGEPPAAERGGIEERAAKRRELLRRRPASGGDYAEPGS